MDHVRLFRRSFETVMGTPPDKRGFVDRFYEIFLARSPQVAESFRGTDMRHQKIMLHDSLHYMVNYTSSENARRYLASVGRIHSRAQRDIAPALYDLWLDSLIDTVAERDPAFDQDVALAWRIAMAPGIAYMKGMYDRYSA